MNAIANFAKRVLGISSPVGTVDDSSTQRSEPKAVYNGYVSGGYGGYGARTGGQKNAGGLSYSGMSRLYDNALLRRNVRDAMYDSPECRAIVQRYADTIAGTGLKLRLQPNFRILGITRQAAEEFAMDTSERFHLYASSKDSSVDGVNTLYQNMHLYAFFQQRENDVYTRLTYSDDLALVSPLQIQFIDPDQINGYGYVSTAGYQFTNGDGIKRNKSGKETGYTISVKNEKGGYDRQEIPAVGASGRRQFLHGFVPEYAGQGKGFSRMSHGLQEFEQITDFKQAHIQQAIGQSMILGWTVPSEDAPASQPLADHMNQNAGIRVDQLLGSNPDPEVVAAYTNGAADISPIQEFAPASGSIFMGNLNKGEDLKFAPNTSPSDSFDSFVNAFVMYLAASVSMPIEMLLLKFGENYSASRAVLVLFWRVVSIWRAEMAADFLNPIVEAWLSEEIGAGRISAPGWQDPRLRKAWLDCRWIGDPVPSIDPNKEAQAAEKRAGLGHETLDDGALGYNGSSGEANRARLQEEIPELVVGPSSPGFKFVNDGKPIGAERVIEVADDGSEVDTVEEDEDEDDDR